MSVNFHSKIQDKEDFRSDPKSIEKYKFVYHFLPHPHHKVRAKLLSHKALFIYCIVLLGFIGVVKIVPMILPGVLGYASNITVTDLLKYSNRKREEMGISTLRLSPTLSKAAEQKANHMFEKDYWAHISPDGVEPWDFILAQGYDYIYAGENLAKNFSVSKEVVEAWMNSSSHRDNLVNASYEEVGFAVVNGVLDGYETTLVVQMFGKPRSPVYLASVYEEEKYLETVDASPKIAPTYRSVREPVAVAQGSQVLPMIDVSMATKSISVLFGLFITFLLGLDIWYSKRRGILKFTGHTLYHLTFFVIIILSVWFVLKPGVIL